MTFSLTEVMFLPFPRVVRVTAQLVCALAILAAVPQPGAATSQDEGTTVSTGTPPATPATEPAPEPPPQPAPDDTAPAEGPPAEIAVPDITVGERVSMRSHRLQLGLSLSSGAGYRTVLPYRSSDCGRGPGRPCSSRRPSFVDIGLAFGVSRAIEVMLEARLGVESDANGASQFWLSPGIKVYFDPHARFKIFTTAQVIFEDTSDPDKGRFDFGIRNATGIQLDFHRNFGLFIQLAENLAFVRALTFEIEGSAGLQGRLP